MDPDDETNFPSTPNEKVTPLDAPNATVERITTANDIETYGTLNQLPSTFTTYRIGVSDAQGARPTMEDSYGFVVDYNRIRGQGLFAIFDGHGNKLAAEWAGTEFHKVTFVPAVHLLEQLHDRPNAPIAPDVLTSMFKSMDGELSKFSVGSANWAASGCTAAVAFLRIEDANGYQSFAPASSSPFLDYYKPNISKPDTPPPKLPATIPPSSARRVLYCANAGDSRIVLSRGGTAKRMTYDHKASDAVEKERVRGLKGVFWRGRVLGQLNITRSLGDHESQQGWSIKKFVVGTPHTEREVLEEDDDFFIMACDGLWDVVTDQEAVDHIRNIEDPKEASKMLLDLAMKKETGDNVTVMVYSGQYSWG
ncbi:hypothetical protein DXG01_000868 [Tephrocybe rancida]|nr:hypothetical protein DXG01_000868 [Tephrocybe rancida]